MMRTNSEQTDMYDQTNALKTLKASIEKIEQAHTRLDDSSSQSGPSFGVETIDSLLNGGFAFQEMHEFRCALARDIGSVCGLVIALLSRLEDHRPIVWICDPATRPDAGRLFPDGLHYFGLDPSRFIHVQPASLSDAFWAAGESARIGGVAATIFQVNANPSAFDLTTSRKLMLRAQQGNSILFVLRQAGEAETSSAATRWGVEPALSLNNNEALNRGLGKMRLSLTLERNRNGRTGQWTVAWNPEKRAFEHAAETSAPADAGLPFQPSIHRPDCPPQMGQVLAHEWAIRRAS